jgi:hypothetical protein
MTLQEEPLPYHMKDPAPYRVMFNETPWERLTNEQKKIAWAMVPAYVLPSDINGA